MTTSNKKPELIAYTVTGTGENTFFHKIGAAWANKKGGFQIKLAANPINGEIVLLPPKESKD